LNFGKKKLFKTPTLLAGKLTPAASVEVQHRQQSVPDENASSINCLSSAVSPEW
jgi:hypothetical protein